MAKTSGIFILLVSLCYAYGEIQLITKPGPGQEYVFLQSSGAGSRPVERKEKPSNDERVFETAHKVPPSLTYILNNDEEPSAKLKREALPEPAEGPAPAPAGAIKLDVHQLLAKYKTDLKASTTQKPSSTRKPSHKESPSRRGRRTKKEAHHNQEHLAATHAPGVVLTTSAAGLLRPIEHDEDVPLVASESEKQRSRIQIKKGPNGQEYEYEYVYYYYDDDEPTSEKTHTNAHDGPARNEVAPQKQTANRSRSSSSTTPEPAANEVLPTASRARGRGRQLDEEVVSEERLPANTRFPPRSRNLNTTPSVEEAAEETKPSRIRGRGRPEASTTASLPGNSSTENNASDESQGTRSRTRTTVRRPSLELVDSASFNTHTSSGEPPNGSGPTFPSDLPAGPVRFLGATPNERVDLSSERQEPVPVEEKSTNQEEETTTVMSAMDKVALDLYAILQGTQRLTGEQDAGTTEIATEVDGGTPEVTTLEPTTEAPTTVATTPSTTTTTTTTTVAPSVVPDVGFGRGKYRNRPALGRKPGTLGGSTTTTTEAPHEEQKPKNKFNRPTFGGRGRPRSTTAPSVESESDKKEDAKPVSSTRTRTRFGAPRSRPTISSHVDGSTEASAPASSRPSLRPRPTFHVRGSRPTSHPETASESPAAEEEAGESSTTTRARPRLNASNVRPLRPGPRINLGGRGRLGASTAAPETPDSASPHEDSQDKVGVEEASEKEPEVTPAPETNPLTRLRNRQRTPLTVRPASPKAAASAPVQVRRTNPLLGRRKPIGVSTTEAAQESVATEGQAEAAEEGATDPAPSSTTTTTEEPKGLNKLLAGRRRLTQRQPGTIA